MSGNNVVETEAAERLSEAFNCLSTSPLHYAVSRGSGRPTFVVSGAFQMKKAPKLKQRGKTAEYTFWSIGPNFAVQNHFKDKYYWRVARWMNAAKDFI